MSNQSNIDAIFSRYKSSFVEKKQMVDDYRQQLSESTRGLPELYSEIHAELHKLAGSLGMYEYDDLAAQARSAMKSAQSCEKDQLEEGLMKLSLLFLEQR